MANTVGFRKVKVFKNIPANTLVQVDDVMFGIGGYQMLEVTNVNLSDSLEITVNINPDGGMPGQAIPVPMNDLPTQIPMMVTNFKATDVVTVVAYGN